MEITLQTRYPFLTGFHGRVVAIGDASQGLVAEVQTILKGLNLYDGSVDCIPGPQTHTAFCQFKEKHYLGQGDLLGETTAASLLEYGEGHQVSEQEENKGQNPIDSNCLGSQTGAQMYLPEKGLVYSNELIVPGVPLTWGEVTKNGTRVPENAAIVANITAIARVFGDVRERYGSPIAVTSGYRPPKVNAAVGGAKRSRHLAGLALDLVPVDGNVERLFVTCQAVKGVTGIGKANNFIHVDARFGARALWYY